MTSSLTRREFVRTLAGAAAVPAALPGLFSPGGDRPPGDIAFGYAAITWGGNDRRAIDDIADVGFRGIQLRANVLERYGRRPEELGDLLARRRLTFVALSSGNVGLDGDQERLIADHVDHARFLSAAGGKYLQLIDERPSGRPVIAEDYARLGRLLTEIGRRTTDLGIPVGYHNHMGGLGEHPDDLARILDAADPRYVHLLLDIAHYQQGGGDPAAAVRRYRDRLLFLHIKDLQRLAPESAGDVNTFRFRFVELGRGIVDIPGVFTALREVRFRGWAVVELDSVPDPARTPKEAAAMNRRYLERVVKLRV